MFVIYVLPVPKTKRGTKFGILFIDLKNFLAVKRDKTLSYVADPPRGFASCFASCLEKVIKRQWGSRRDTNKTLILYYQILSQEIKTKIWFWDQFVC